MVEQTDSVKMAKNRLTLQAGKSHFCSIRQYVTKIDQFLYLLELDHVLFPAYTNMEVKRDFRVALNRTKRSVTNLKNKLFKIADKPNGVKMTEMRYKRKRKGEDLSPPSPKNCKKGPTRFQFTSCKKDSDIIDITSDDERSNVDTFAVNSTNQSGKVDAFAVNNTEQPQKVDAFTAEDSKMNEAAISLLTLKNKPVTSIVHLNKINVPMKNTQRLTLLNRDDLIERIRTYAKQRIDLSKSQVETVKLTSPASNTHTEVIKVPQKELPVVEINGVSYSIDTVDFEVLPFLVSDNK